LSMIWRWKQISRNIAVRVIVAEMSSALLTGPMPAMSNCGLQRASRVMFPASAKTSGRSVIGQNALYLVARRALVFAMSLAVLRRRELAQETPQFNKPVALVANGGHRSGLLDRLCR
jgi:hypothetical protein